MSWLYEHRDRLNGLRPFVEMAYKAVYPVPAEDKDDVEQDIIITLLRVSQKNSNTDYLRGVARTQVKRYWQKKCYREGKARVFYEGEDFPSQGVDIDARLDAISALAALPVRLVEIGHKRLYGHKLHAADQKYLTAAKQARNGWQVSEWERKRIARLRSEGLSVNQIFIATGRARGTINMCLKNN